MTNYAIYFSDSALPVDIGNIRKKSSNKKKVDPHGLLVSVSEDIGLIWYLSIANNFH
jgi:hypothetical protein